ncbi:MAG: hypothetical protein M3R27_05490 [Bacteroidota bacterium]|nr:hypothetical protein [Bacteroidota bacterium]
MTKNLFKTAVIFLFVLSPAFISETFAVGMGMGMGMGPPIPCGGPFPPCPIPLDGGVTLLLIAGAAYGGKKLYDSTKKNPA